MSETDGFCLSHCFVQLKKNEVLLTRQQHTLEDPFRRLCSDLIKTFQIMLELYFMMERGREWREVKKVFRAVLRLRLVSCRFPCRACLSCGIFAPARNTSSKERPSAIPPRRRASLSRVNIDVTTLTDNNTTTDTRRTCTVVPLPQACGYQKLQNI